MVQFWRWCWCAKYPFETAHMHAELSRDCPCMRNWVVTGVVGVGIDLLLYCACDTMKNVNHIKINNLSGQYDFGTIEYCVFDTMKYFHSAEISTPSGHFDISNAWDVQMDPSDWIEHYECMMMIESQLGNPELLRLKTANSEMNESGILTSPKAGMCQYIAARQWKRFERSSKVPCFWNFAIF